VTYQPHQSEHTATKPVAAAPAVPTKEVRCTDGCGTTATIEVTLNEPPGWQTLPLHGRQRCPGCAKALREVNGR
jgi:hypothetical protein